MSWASAHSPLFFCLRPASLKQEAALGYHAAMQAAFKHKRVGANCYAMVAVLSTAAIFGFCLPGCGLQSKRLDAAVAPEVTRNPAEANTKQPYESTTPAPVGRPVQGLIGQVAGDPIYAHAVLDGIEEQLAAIGQRESSEVFRERAYALILRRVQEIVQNMLTLDEAERALSTAEQAGLRMMMDFQREELLRRYGRGSIALAKRNIVEQTGTTLDKTLQDFRDTVIIRTYLDRNLDPLVEVNRRDIARFYRDNYERFNPQAKREVLLLWASDEAQAEAFQKRLESGEPFAQVADDPANAYAGGNSPYEVTGDAEVFGSKVDPALFDLEADQWVGPIRERGRFWFIYLQSLDQPQRISELEAQVEIERTLRDNQSRVLREDLAQRLRDEGSFTVEDEMAQAVLEIAVSRYAAAN